MTKLLDIALFVSVVVAQSSDSRNVLNTCIDGKYHKSKPESEPDLFGECAPWRSRACCDHTSTFTFHQSDNWLDFNWNHCPGHTLSDACRAHFVRDLCFYECSPNTGPWITEQTSEIRNERFMHIPLCQTECDKWWNDCKHEFTCLGNWEVGFNWTTGTNTCPTGATCRPFTNMFGNATNFCNMIWDNSYKAVADDQPCMKISFTGQNPNDAVAQYYVNHNIVNAIG